MKYLWVLIILAVWFVNGCSTANSQTAWPLETKPQSIREVMAKVADWQIANPSKHHPADWTHGALYAGMTAWAKMSDDDKYMNWLKQRGQELQWQPYKRIYHADDHCVGWMYLELYSLYKDPQMMQPIKERFDYILNNPSDVTLKTGQQQKKDRWWWCDALFMAPPVLAKLSALTGDRKYLDFMHREFMATTDYLYDKEEHLYFRDDKYFNQREANGKKIFWSRGNGWVFAGLARILETMPENYQGREKYVEIYKQMAAKLISIQGADGLWRASLLDPASYPEKETSGTGFYCYGLAWGVNRGILDEKTYLPAIVKAWNGLVGCVNPDGKLGYVQPIGADPKKVSPDQTEVYGVGAFLYAGSEVYKLAVGRGDVTTRVHLTNPAAMFRDAQTVSLNWKDLVGKNPSLTAANVVVFDFNTNQFIVTQAVDNDSDDKIDEFLFQTDFAPGQQKWFQVMNLPQGFSRPQTKECVYGRHVPERYSDFAWENDRIAFRMYAKELEWETVSPGIDVWVKKVRTPMMDNLYKNVQAKKSYHADSGEGLDCYKVGPTLGCGGLGILAGDQLILSRNYTAWKILAKGPIRFIFELSYDPWEAAGVKVSEVKRISLDKGSNLNRIESRLTCDSQMPLRLAAGIVTRSGQQEDKKLNPDQQWISYWFAPDKENGMTGCGVVLTPETKAALKEQNNHLLAIVEQPCGQPFVYYAGACWDRGLDFKTAADWQAYLSGFARQLEKPVVVTLEK
jgi:unsaturated rhamnogalacturonyl hydrolase